MENIFTLIATDPIADPIEPEDKCLEAFIPSVRSTSNVEELDTVTHVQMVMAMHKALLRLNKTNLADYPEGCSGTNNSFIFG